MAKPQQGRTSGAQVVYAELKRQILALELKPGERLYEPGLAASLGVSRTPLREAVRILLAENLLEQHTTGGVLVPALDAREIAELYDVRATLEGYMAAEACKNMTEEKLAGLEALIERNAALITFPDETMVVGKAIHGGVAEIAGNSWALRLYGQVASQMLRYKMFTNHSQARRHQALAEHREIVEALRRGDPTFARNVAFDHAISARDEALRTIHRQLSG